MNSVLKSFDLTGRLALVTGSSAGIGYALARGLAGAGARVILNARNEAKLSEGAARLTAELLNKGLVDLKPLISATLPFRDAGRAFALAADRSQAMKVLLSFE